MYPNLFSEMTRFDVSINAIAKLLGKAPNNVRARFNGTKGILFGEACKIRDFFNDNYDTNFTVDYLFANEPITV